MQDLFSFLWRQTESLAFIHALRSHLFFHLVHFLIDTLRYQLLCQGCFVFLHVLLDVGVIGYVLVWVEEFHVHLEQLEEGMLGVSGDCETASRPLLVLGNIADLSLVERRLSVVDCYGIEELEKVLEQNPETAIIAVILGVSIFVMRPKSLIKFL